MSSTHNAFDRLRDLLRDVAAPVGLDPIRLHLGESRLVAPPIDTAVLAGLDGWSRYPELGGPVALRKAYQSWLGRRFGIPPPTMASRAPLAVEPTPGSKQALAVLIAQAVGRATAAGVTDPVVVSPNPGYPTYLAATLAARARPVLYAGDDLTSCLAAETGRVAAVIVCHPGNPRGETRNRDQLQQLADLAWKAGAALVVDECYIDLWLGTAPPGFLSVAVHPSLEFVVVHTLSKRSGAPGLRSGFVVGHPTTVAAYAEYNRTCGVPLPRPVCEAAAALWADDAHVARARAALARNWDRADVLLKDVPGYRRAEAGFFLWLPVADDTETARRLWGNHALTVMPGRFLAADDSTGGNPGVGHLRIALVHDESRTEAALARLREGL
ncbi:aminotransferase class I/II-fold pyridoxal phosphate-dependent enzyme [Micromonospora sp. HUAS LYJ1]|uniref:aminotransferase class I/II-fold pyridoxal phosphate-dependent enzyme n=1 Tax=Micromonospora sp. HUAS LYJ1 TaxID=3061626 RepID=UPI002673ECEB|nr:aminotransferase class I/II-fold pyridoxal phosphate-dependent enzyme [Micromonospora sp. HUAS LYJ1]WKU04448.1 aminotransferase class I/II-fold pyridoxal phosphate-dependent enzyme [Micromonospora sp. HUAS LYJ1]